MSTVENNENSQTVADDSAIHFVEFINYPFVNISDKDERDSHIVLENVSINKNDEMGEMHYLLENNEQSVDLDNQIIVIHDGKQFLFNSDQLNAKGEFILNSSSGLESLILSDPSNTTEYIMPDDQTEDESIEANEITTIDDVNNQKYRVVNENTINDSKSLPVYLEELEENESEVTTKNNGKRKQYAILKDGKLYIQDGDIDQSNLYNTDNVNDSVQLDDSLQGEINESLDDDSVSSFGVAGRNLITGQTISLDSFITKLGINSTLNGVLPIETKLNIKNSKKTEKKPKRIIGKIIAIKRPGEELNPVTDDKATDLPSVSVPTNFFEKPEFKTTINAIIKPSGEIETDVDSYFQVDSSNLLQQEKNEIVHYLSTQPMDELVVKTLCGLMDMESFSKHLIDKNLIIKNTYKRVNSITDQCLYKEVNYYKGYMEKLHTINDLNEVVEQWHFQQNTEITLDDSEDEIKSSEKSQDSSVSDESNNIDLTINETDTQQIDLSANQTDKVNEIDEQSSSLKNVVRKVHNVPDKVTVHVLITEDEFGKKRTKVMIPKLSDTGKFCSICNKMFRNPQIYKRHMKSAHSTNDNKSNTCDLCNKKFCDASTLTRHRRIHNGDKNYQCNLCFKAFNTTGSLKRHITIHIPSLRPLQCLKCLQRFTDRSSLKKHMLLHTGLKPFQCDVCFKRFVHIGDLNFHRKIHDPSKQYTCETCGKEFNRHSNLLRHLDIHKDNGNVFKCDICGCCYNFMSSLTRHIVNHHMKDS